MIETRLKKKHVWYFFLLESKGTRFLVGIIRDPMCQHLSLRRQQCHDLYGKQGEDCLHEELAEKRCLSHHHCPNEAYAYYGKPNASKALCASWAEVFAFRDSIEEGNHHLEAVELVNSSNKDRAQCRNIAMELAKCMQRNYKRR